MAKKSNGESSKLINIAAVLVVIASMFAAVCWITSGKAGGEASDRKTAALGYMMLRLESETAASNYLTRAQMHTTLAEVALARAEAEENVELKEYFENTWYSNIVMANFYAQQATDAENRTNSYYDNYEGALATAATLGTVSDYRSTGALVFNVSATLASFGVLLKRKEILLVYFPTAGIGLIYLIMSLL